MKTTNRVITGMFIFISLFIQNSNSKAYSYKEVIRYFDNLYSPDMPINPEEDMTVGEIIQYHGYPLEEHEIITKDGYILSVQRIPHGKNNSSSRRESVLILPGLFAVSAVFIINTPDKNLPYLLAEEGYDVWLGNFRGSTFGKKHVSLSSKHKSFWNFSLDEMIIYDVPDMIDYILNNTGYKYLHCIGHSMGNTNAFATLASIPEYNEKIRSLHALGPSVKLDHLTSPVLRFYISFLDVLTSFHKLVGNLEMLRYSPVNEFFARMGLKWSPQLYISLYYHVVDNFDSSQFNWLRMPIYVHFYPAGTSFKTALHYFQIAAKGRFQRYDYGEKENMEKYNQTVPPLYDITKITCPVALYWAENDRIAPGKDVVYLIENLKNLALSYRIPLKKFNHEDFVLALDIVPLVYEKLIKTLNQLSGNITS